MSENGRKWPLPASEVYDHPIYGKVVRCNIDLNHPDEELIRHRGRFVAWSMRVQPGSWFVRTVPVTSPGRRNPVACPKP